MTEQSPLDHAHAQMLADGDSPRTRLRFYERLVESELFLLLEREATGATVEPRLLGIDGVNFALVFDREERLADFAGSSPYAALSGRAVAGMLAQERLGLGVNLEVAPSAILLPPDAVQWLAKVVSSGPEISRELPREFGPPQSADPAVVQALAEKLALAEGLADSAWLVDAVYENGSVSPLLVIVGTVAGVDSAIARTIGEAVGFSGVEGAVVDVTFVSAGDAILERLARVGIRFDLPVPDVPEHRTIAPGSDPEVPPKLR